MNIQAMMKQAQKLQNDMMKVKEEIDKTEFTAENGLVKVKIKDKKEVIEVKIKTEETLEAEDVEMLQDMIMIAMNEAMEQVDKMTEQKMGKFSNAMPGLF